MIRRSRRVVCLAGAAAWVLFASAGLRAAAPQPKGLSAAQVAIELRKLVAAKALRGAHVSAAAIDLADGTWLFEHEADRLCSVASNNKLMTTAAALELLGPDYQFRTTVAAVGKVSKAGVLAGDLLVIGRGEPSISGRFHDGKVTAALELWARAVAQAGIREVRGAVVADDTWFDQQHTHPEWPQGQHSGWYSAQVGALSFNDNCVLLLVRPGRKRGAAALCAVEPKTAYVRLINSCTTSRARRGANKVLAHRALGRNDIHVGGHIRQDSAPFRTWVTVDDPALFAATVFREVLVAKGIRVGAPARRRTPTYRVEPSAYREIITTTSSSVSDAVAVANQRSQNFYAEQLLKTLGREKAGKGTWPAGAEVVTAFLRRAGLKGTFDYRDGSGLARGNRFSARQVVQLLAYMHGQPNGETYRKSLAEPGGDGTLRTRLLGLRERLRAKTGYIAGASALSGYLETQGKRLVAFSVLVNDFRTSLADVRAAQDALCLKLAAYAP